MESIREGDLLILRLERGEDVLPCIERAMEEQWARRAVMVSGLGAMEQVEVGCFDPRTKSYVKRVFEDTHEVLSMTGIIVQQGYPPLFQPHLHVTLADREHRAFGGHFFGGRVAATAEFALRVISNASMHRARDPELGLQLLRVHA